ncbi:MAG: pyruvate kinase [Opitutales bacterium]|nr:pyruvate kinase [Opitutales bacterium]
MNESRSGITTVPFKKEKLQPNTSSRIRQTKIIFTIGPATMSEEALERLIIQGVDICRINMAHADHEWTREICDRVRKVCDKVGRQIAIMMDVKGPEIRTGKVGDEPYILQEGEIFDFVMEYTDEDQSLDGKRYIDVNYPDLDKDVSVGDTVLVDSGLMSLEVIEKRAGRIRTRVIIPGPLGNKRHINLPGVRVNLPSLTEKDMGDISVGIEKNVEFYALSFVRESYDLDLLRRHLTDHDSNALIIAKIEDQQAISNLDDIIAASDGLMVARGDLGIECPYEELPIIQHRAIKTCLRIGRPVIVATHMLESMIENPVPTRAEVSDVSTAVLEKADCIMLSGETTTGKYPFECIEVFKRISMRIEEASQTNNFDGVDLKTPKSKMLKSAASLAAELDHCAIVVFTRSGYLAKMMSSLRPKSPVFAFTDNPELFRHLLILWGIEPFLMDFSDDPEQTIENAMAALKKRPWIESGDNVVCVTNVLTKGDIIDSIQLRRAP